MYKNHKVVMIATCKRSHLYKLDLEYDLNFAPSFLDDISETKNQHLYILGNEIAKKGDFAIHHGKLYSVLGDNSTSYINTEDAQLYTESNNILKVIATTDKTLFYISELTEVGRHQKSMIYESGLPYPKFEDAIKMGWFLSSNIKRISQDFIKLYIEAYNERNPILEVTVNYASKNSSPFVSAKNEISIQETRRAFPTINKFHKDSTKNSSEHLEWIYNRLIHKYGENENVDYMLQFKKIINQTK